MSNDILEVLSENDEEDQMETLFKNQSSHLVDRSEYKVLRSAEEIRECL